MAISRRTKNVGLSLGLAAATFAPLSALPAQADAGGNQALAFCRSIAGFYDGNITGPCVSYFVSHNFSARATTQFFCRTVFVPAGEFATLSKCLRVVGRL